MEQALIFHFLPEMRNINLNYKRLRTINNIKKELLKVKNFDLHHKL